MKITTVLLFLTVLCTVRAQRVGFGKCPDANVKTDFNVSKYMGKWYTIERNWNIFMRGYKCSSVLYNNTGLPDGCIKVFNSLVKDDDIPVSSYSMMWAPDPNVPAKMINKYQTVLGWRTGPYWVLDTDYDTYTVVYSCSSVEPLLHVDFIWLLAREKTVSDEVKTKMHSILTRNGISLRGLQTEDQSCYMTGPNRRPFRLAGPSNLRPTKL